LLSAYLITVKAAEFLGVKAHTLANWISNKCYLELKSREAAN
jgi:hypothetical protein